MNSATFHQKREATPTLGEGVAGIPILYHFSNSFITNDVQPSVQDLVLRKAAVTSSFEATQRKAGT